MHACMQLLLYTAESSDDINSYKNSECMGISHHIIKGVHVNMKLTK